MQGLLGQCCVLLKPLKNQPFPLPFLFPFQFASLHFLLVTLVTHGVSSCLATLCSQADAIPQAVSQPAGPVPGGPASLGRQQLAGLRTSMAGSTEEPSVVFPRGRCGRAAQPRSAPWAIYEVVVTQHHTLGPASSSDARAQDLPLTWNVALVFWVPTSPGGGTTDCPPQQGECRDGEPSWSNS